MACVSGVKAPKRGRCDVEKAVMVCFQAMVVDLVTLLQMSKLIRKVTYGNN